MELLPLDPQSVLRILCGIWFLPHCIGKARNVDGAALTFQKAGFPAPRALVFVTIAVEIAAAIGLVTGVLEVGGGGACRRWCWRRELRGAQDQWPELAVAEAGPGIHGVLGRAHALSR